MTFNLFTKDYIVTPRLTKYFYDVVSNDNYNTPYIIQQKKELSLSNSGNRIKKYFQIFQDVNILPLPLSYTYVDYLFYKFLTTDSFLLQSESQYNSMIKLETELNNITNKYVSRKSFLQYFKTSNHNIFNHTEDVLWEFAKRLQFGFGFEIISLKHDNKLSKVQDEIQTYLGSGKCNFKKDLHYNRIIDNLPELFIKYLHEIIALTVRSELKLFHVLLNSIDKPHNMLITRDEINELSDIFSSSYEDS
jgi:hypothetical protein